MNLTQINFRLHIIKPDVSVEKKIMKHACHILLGRLIINKSLQLNCTFNNVKRNDEVVKILAYIPYKNSHDIYK